MPPLNPAVRATDAPPIPAIVARAAAYSGARGPLLNLSQAAPAHPPAPEMLERLAQAAGDPATAGYGPILGEPALREAYAADLRGDGDTAARAANIVVTAGCNLAFAIAANAVAGPGDAVLVPTPWYFNHAMTLRMQGVEPRPLPTRAEAGFVPDPEVAARLLDASRERGRVRAILLVTPNNPTGAIYPPAVIAAFHALCRARGIWLILDETYRDLVAGRPHALLGGEEWPEDLLHLTSFSKSFAIPGHRMGILGAPEAAIPEIAKLVDSVQICAGRPAQHALAWGIPALRDWRRANRDRLASRAAAVRATFAGLESWDLLSIGAYFAYVRHPFAGTPAARVAEHLAEEHGLIALPGPAFAGEESHLRLSFANLPEERLPELVARLRNAAAEPLAKAA
jgi:aspartate/methionine/tyrosine aminotransferase